MTKPRSRKKISLFVLSLLAVVCCYRTKDYSPTAPSVASAITLQVMGGVTSIAADGLSRVSLLATIASNADSDKRTVTFTTSSGSFVGSTTATPNTIDVVADSSGKAVAQLQSSQIVGTAIVTAVVKAAAGSPPLAAAQLQIGFTAPDPNSVLQFLVAPGSAPADGQTVTLFKVGVSPTVTTGTVTFSATGGAFSSPTAQIALDHTATAGLMSPKAPGAATVSATLAASGGVNGFSRQAPIRFEIAFPEIITVQLDNLAIAPGGKAQVTAHFSRRVGQVTANTVAVFNATNSSGSPVGGFENVTVVQPGSSTSDSIATADFLPGASANPGPVTIRVGTDPASVTGSTTITITKPGG